MISSRGRKASHIKRTGGGGGWCLLEIFEKNPSRYQYPILWAWLEMFSPQRGTNSKTTHHHLSFFFRLKTLQGTAKAPAVDLLRLNSLKLNYAFNA